MSQAQTLTATLKPWTSATLHLCLRYQGESNVVKCDTHIYTDKTLALATGWREVFQQPELPLYTVQLAPFCYTEAFGPTWEEQGHEIRAEW